MQILQIEAFQQRYLKCKCETPYLAAEWKMPFLANCVHFCRNIFFSSFRLIKSTQWNYLRLFPKASKNISKNYNFVLKGLQIEAFQQR